MLRLSCIEVRTNAKLSVGIFLGSFVLYTRPLDANKACSECSRDSVVCASKDLKFISKFIKNLSSSSSGVPIPTVLSSFAPYSVLQTENGKVS